MNSKRTWIRGIDDADLQKLFREQAQANAGTTPAVAANDPAAGAGGVRRATNGFVFMRPPCRGLDCPTLPVEASPPADPCNGFDWVWQPPLAIRVVNQGGKCPSDAQISSIKQNIKANVRNFQFHDPEVRVSCANAIIDILIWAGTVHPNSCDDLARKRAQIPPDIADGGFFGIYVSSELIRYLARKAFEEAPKTLDASGAPSSDGPLHLTGLSVDFQPPQTILTKISGYDERPWPDVSFVTTLTDDLQENRDSKPTSNTNSSKTNDTVTGILAGLLGVVIDSIPLVLPLQAFVIFNDVDPLLNAPDNQTQDGAGARVLAGLPVQIPLPASEGFAGKTAALAVGTASGGATTVQPQKKKLVLEYLLPRVDDRGMLVSANVNEQDRHPAAHIAGPRVVTAFAFQSRVSSTYLALAQDLLGALTFRWSADGDVVIERSDAASTKISFTPGANAGKSFSRTLTLRVTDGEGSSATATLTVTINLGHG